MHILHSTTIAYVIIPIILRSMVDHVSSVKRSKIMAAIKGRDTKPELLIRKLLYARGYRYRLNCKDLPGKPDIVMRSRKIAIFVHGCFWHGHGCAMAKSLPKTRVGFWENKILNNKARDARVVDDLLSQGWRVCVIWNCALERKAKLPIDALAGCLFKWIEGKRKYFVIEGRVV